MKTVEEIIDLFPNLINKKYDWFERPSYDQIIEKFGEIILESHLGDYQGDSFYIITNNKKYGFICFGWGSCSGCDSLQGCDDYKDITDLFNSLESGIVWKDSKIEFKKWLKEHDWKGEFYYRDSTDFITKINEYFKLSIEIPKQDD